MIITFWKGVFVADDDGLKNPGALKKGGFQLHEPTICSMKKEDCKGCRAKIGRRWWSSRMEDATSLKQFCNERALRVMKNHLEILQRSRATDAKIEIPRPEGLEYLPYQKAGVAYAIQRKDTLIGDDMGLGKTVEALGFLNVLKPKRTLIIAPRTLIFNWRDEAEKWLTGFDHQIFEIESSQQQIPNVPGVFITNYEKVAKEDSPLTKSILSQQWDVAIYDEAHYVKNPDSSRSKAILNPGGIVHIARRNLFLTGTPIENYPREIWAIAAALAPAKFGDRQAFEKRYCAGHIEDRKMRNKDGREYTRHVWVADGSSHLGELQQRLRSSFLVRRLKADVLKELPPKRRQLVVLKDNKIDWARDPRFTRWKAVYDEQYESASAKLESAKTAEEYRNAALDLDEVTGIAFTEMSEVRHAVAQAKLPAAIAYLEEVMKAGAKNLVVFAHHRDVIQELAKHFGEDAVVVSGDTPNKGPRSREWAVREFQEGRKKIFIGQTRAAGVGITLTAADTVVFVEVDWVPGVVTQCEDRLCRIGQKKMVHVIHLVLGGTMEVNMVQKLIRKQDVIDRALDKMPEIKLRKAS